jgi:hypothetical protein
MTTTGGRSTTDAQSGYTDAPIRRVTAGNGIEYAYHDLGASEVPLPASQPVRRRRRRLPRGSHLIPTRAAGQALIAPGNS